MLLLARLSCLHSRPFKKKKKNYTSLGHRFILGGDKSPLATILKDSTDPLNSEYDENHGVGDCVSLQPSISEN